MGSCEKKAVLLVPGLWFGRPALWLLAYRLARYGFRVHLYPYRSLRQAQPDACEDLACYAAAHGARYVVGYSLGGVLVLAFCSRYPDLYTRAVTLGAPFRGSRVVRHLWRCAPIRPLWGAAAPELLRGLRLPAPARLAVVTGTRHSWGLAALGLKEGPHDGVVTASEARLRGAADAVALDVSHLGLVTRAVSARAVAAYLMRGQLGGL